MAMKKINVADATGPALDWLVAKCEGLDPFINTPYDGNSYTHGGRCFAQRYSTNWTQGGPIIFEHGIATAESEKGLWLALPHEGGDSYWEGPTPLIAAMRCYVASKLGHTAEVPEELL